jgi:hypothetical protein
MTVENVSMRSHATGFIEIETQIEIGFEIEIEVPNFFKLCG